MTPEIRMEILGSSNPRVLSLCFLSSFKSFPHLAHGLVISHFFTLLPFW